MEEELERAGYAEILELEPAPGEPLDLDPPAAPRSSPGSWAGHAAGLASLGSVKARVLIRPKEGILDPQGKAVERALPALGFEGISHVRVGRLVELEAENGADLKRLCEQLLANPLIEDFEVLENVE